MLGVFIGYSTWKWIEVQKQTGEAPAYRYQFDQAPPIPEGAKGPEADRGASTPRKSSLCSATWLRRKCNGGPRTGGYPN